jgi:spore coat protein H
MTSMILLPLVLFAGGLWNYHLTIAPEHLQALYDNPESEALFPGHIASPAGESDCLVGFRGTTSLLLPKKSWRIDLTDPGLIGRTRINLDAHYRDLTMMRNHLAMELVRRMGYPAPITRHVTFSVNGENMGVYLETERIDGDFMLRNSLPGGALFQAMEGSSRFVPFLSGHDQADGFSPRTGSEYMVPELIRLIGDVCGGGEFESRFDTGMFLGNMAANLAMVETDAPSKNYFLQLGHDGNWRYFPWDHDASFGNDWQGDFHRDYLSWVFTTHMQLQSPFLRLMTDPEHRNTFRSGLIQAAEIMASELPASLDSVRNAIREDVYLDPLRAGTPEDFEAACDSLLWFITERADITPDLYRHHFPPDVLDIRVEPAWITPGTRSVEVTATCSDSLVWCELNVIVDGAPPEMVEMEHVPGSGGRMWRAEIGGEFTFTSSLRFFIKICQSTIPWPEPLVYYPTHAIFGDIYKNEALPGVARVAEPPILEKLMPVTQMRLGPALWALPLRNDSEREMDLSLCHISLGNPPSRVFFPENLLLQPGETLFVTSGLEAFSLELPGRISVGDCASSSAAGYGMTLFDPSWNKAVFHQVPPGERHVRLADILPLITEISYSQPLYFPSDDWMELHNPGREWIDLSLTGISDSDQGHTVFPQGTMIPPFGFLVLASDTDLFTAQYPDVGCDVVKMGFRLSSDGETLRFISRGGHSIEMMSYGTGSPWPPDDEGIIAITGPHRDPADPASWVATAQPGTPGAANPEWFGENESGIRIQSLRPNPSRNGPLFFSLSGGAGPVFVQLFDLTGRVAYIRGFIEPGMPEYTLELPPGLPSGVYFLVVSSGGNTATRKLLWLR